MDEKSIKKIIQTQIAPLLIGIRNDLEENKKGIDTLSEEVKKKSKLEYELEIDNKDYKGLDGTTPVSDKDYPSFKTVEQWVIKNIPKKGKDYFTSKEIKEIVKEVFSLTPKPKNGKNGKNGKVDYKLVKEMINEKLIQNKNFIDSTIDSFYKEVAKKYKKLTAKEIRDELESLKGNSRLDAKAIRGLEKYVTSYIVQSGGGGGGGASAFTSLTDTFASYAGLAGKGLRVNGTETGIDTYTPTDTDEKVKLNVSDPTAGYLDDKITGYGFLTDISGQDLSTADNSTSQFITQGDIDWATNVPSYETDPVYTSSSWYSTTNNSANWDTAYGWGNHASAGYAYSSDLTAYAKLDGSNHPFTYVKTPNIRPNADSTTAVQITKADGITPVMTFDTTNVSVGINTTPNATSGTVIHLYNSANTGTVASNSTAILESVNRYSNYQGRGGTTGATSMQSLSQDASVNYGQMTIANHATDPYQYWALLGVEKMRLTKDGYLGIGTSAPTRILDILRSQNASTPIEVTNLTNGTSALAAVMVSSATGRGQLFVTGTNYTDVTAWTNRVNILSDSGSTGINIIASAATGDIRFITSSNTAERMRITSAGLVGIGTTAPLTQFEVSGSTGGLTLTRTSDVAADEPFVLLRKNSTPSNIAQIRGIHGGGLRFTNGASDVEWARITSAGNVGIGTTAPAGTLEVASSPVGTQCYITKFGDDASGSYAILQKTRGANATTLTATQNNDFLGIFQFNGVNTSSARAISARIIVQQTAAAGSTWVPANMQFRTASSSAENTVMTLTSDNRVGIGTTTPGTKLAIAGTHVSGLGLLQVSGATAVSDAWLTIDSGANKDAGFYFKNNGGTGVASWYVYNSGAAGANTFKIDSGATNRFTILSTGYVGIGTTSPSARLHSLATTEQLRLGYDASNYMSATVDSAGSITFALTGTTPKFTFSQAVKLSTLTSGRIPFATTGGELIDDSDLTFATDTLTATKIVGTTSVKVGTAGGFISSDGSTGATGSFTTADLKTVTVKDGIITSIV